MSGDRLADMRERAAWVIEVCDPYAALYPAETAGALARDVLAVVEIAKAAQDTVDAYEADVAWEDLRVTELAAALARLDSGAAEGDA